MVKKSSLSFPIFNEMHIFLIRLYISAYVSNISRHLTSNDVNVNGIYKFLINFDYR